MKADSLSPAEAIKRGRSIVERDYQGFSTDEARKIIAGLLVLVDAASVDAAFRNILSGSEK
jgi:hypothetical protein